jgi:hypothetical protein
MAGSGASGDTGGYFVLLKELREFREGPLGGEPPLRALGRAADPGRPVKADTVKAWLGGQFPQEAGKFLSVVRAVAAEARARGIAPVGRHAAVLDVEQWRSEYEEEARRRAGEVSAGALRGLAARALAGVAAGWPLTEVTNPFDLEVHYPLRLDGQQQEFPDLPAYVLREHDRALAEVVQAAAEGRSGIAVLVGGSSTGKTRACWEVLELLRGRPERWRLWHPIDPSRPEAALRELSSIGPRTVVRLNDAQFYLGVTADGLGEQVAAGLRQLLRDKDKAPVLVLATLWPEFWGRLTTRPEANADDPHAHARELLAGWDIAVPAAFTEEQMQQLSAIADRRLAHAAESAEDGHVIQFLAGAAELTARYRNAPPGAAALMNAAIDARRLGMGIALPLAFLQAAASDYLNNTDWDGLDDDWLEQALAYTSAPCNGIRGALSRIRSRTTPAPSPVCRLADYLEQHGRRSRRSIIPRAGFWNAAARFAGLGDLPALAEAAEDRGLLRDAARMRKHATARRDTSQAVALVTKWYSLYPRPVDPAPAQWAADHAVLDDPGAVNQLLRTLSAVGAHDQAAALASRAADHVRLNDPSGVADLLDVLREFGAEQQTAALIARSPADHVPLHEPGPIARLLHFLRKAGAEQQAAALIARSPADHVRLNDLDDPDNIAFLLSVLREAGSPRQASILATRAANHVPLDDPDAVAEMMEALQEGGARKQAAVLATRAANHTPVDNPDAVDKMMEALRDGGARKQAAVLATRAADHASLDHPGVVGWLLESLRKVGADKQASALIAHNPADYVPLDDPGGVAWLIRELAEAGALEASFRPNCQQPRRPRPPRPPGRRCQAARHSVLGRCKTASYHPRQPSRRPRAPRQRDPRPLVAEGLAHGRPRRTGQNSSRPSARRRKVRSV